MKMLSGRGDRLSSLIEPHFGNRIATRAQLARLQPILAAAPEVDPAALDQVAALPLGGRVKVDPWSARTELMKTSSVAPRSAREKMPFQITPLMPFLIRHQTTAATAAATTTNNDEPLQAEAR